MKPIALITCWLLVTRLAVAGPVAFDEARPDAEMDGRFENAEGWIGGDGDYSVALTPERTLWLFSDTWVGKVREGKRVDATIVNNTVGLQDGHGAKVQFIVRQDEAGKPMAFVSPEDQRGWFWLQAGAYTGDRLYLFLMQVEKTDAKGVFGFRQVGQWLGVVTNPLDPPLTWHVEQYKLPCVSFGPERQVSFGAAVVVHDDYLYIYGTDEDIKARGRDRYLIVARVPTNEVADLAAWRFYADGKWVTDYTQASRVADGMASECSVSFLPKLGKYALVYTDRGLSPKIQVRTAAKPWGEWSAAATVYRCPEMGRDKKIFCYAAKAHPELGAEDELVISYVASSFDFWQVAGDASLYWPRFVRVKLKN